MLVTGLSRSKGVSVVSRQHLGLLLDRMGHEQGSPISLADAIAIALTSARRLVLARM